MKNIILISIVLSGLSGCSQIETRPLKVSKAYDATVPQQVSPVDAKQLEAPILETGQKWTYRRIDLWNHKEIERFRQELMFPDDGLWIVRWSILNSDKYSRMGSVTGEILDPRYQSFSDASMTGEHEPLRFPLSRGKSWKFEYSIPSKRVTVEQTATVGGWETVTVPAGRFRALRITHEGNYSASAGQFSWSGRITETYWYSPEARRVVKKEYQDTNGEGSTWDQWREELVDLKL